MFLRYIGIVGIIIGMLEAVFFVFSRYQPTSPQTMYPSLTEERRRVSTTSPVSEKSETVGTSTAKIQTPPKPKQNLSKTSVPKSLTQPASPPIPLSKTINSDELYSEYQGAVFNIWCIEGNHATSGTATIIDPSGILITNAHVVRDIKDAKNCVLRKANPFENVAEFQILFIADQTALIEGTDLPQNDFAFIKITRAFDASRGAPWPFVPLSVNIPNPGDVLFIFGYATEFVGFEISVKGIPLTFSTLTVTAQATVDDDLTTAEAILLGGGLSAQSGSSGGPLIDFNKKIVALMSFVTKGRTTADRKGAAILISYVDRELKKTTGLTLKEFLEKNSVPSDMPAATNL